MIEKFKKTLKNDGRSLKWFFDKYVRDSLSITYVYMTAQLNGFNNLTIELESKIKDYLQCQNIES